MSNYLRNFIFAIPAKRGRGKWKLYALIAAMAFAFNAKAQLSGTYTVCPTGCNYSTLTSAVNALNTQGVSGPVDIVLTATTYSSTETFPIVINQITGASSTNRITIRPGANASPTITGSTATATALIKLNGADFVTIDGSNTRGGTTRNLSIINTSTLTNTAAIWVSSLGTTSASRQDSIKNVNIAAGSNSVTSTFGIYVAGTTISTTGTGANNDSLTIQNNSITNAYYGIFARGVSSTGLLDKLVITQNSIGSANSAEYVTYRGVELQNTTVPEISRNTIFNLKLSTSVNNAAIDLGQNNANALISRNTITGIYSTSSGGYGAYGINISSGTGNSGITIVNNMISDIITSNYSGTSTTWNAYGIRLTGGTGFKIYHNSVNLFGSPTTGTTGTLSAALLTTSSTVTADIRNNILSNTMTGLSGARSMAIYLNSASNIINIDYNNYWVDGPNAVLGYLGSDRETLIDWQAATGDDKNSVSVSPGFQSNTNLHFSGNTVKPIGTDVDVTIDIDGDSRCESLPSIGADESEVGKNPTASFIGPDTIYVNSPTEFFSTNMALFNVWYFNGVRVQDSLHLNLIAPNTGTFELKLVGLGCNVKDSVTKNIVVISPTKAPTANFVADVNDIEPGEIVKFFDLSTGGTSKWKWAITPATAVAAGKVLDAYSYVYGNDSSREVWVKFNYGGSYRVCFTASNSVGSNTLCRDNYITVSSEYSMIRGSLVLADTSGTLYDDGGPNGDYSSSFTGNVLIAPCADEIYVVIKKFETECSWDYVRIFDGSDNSGVPLHRCTTNVTGTRGPGLTGAPTSSTCTAYCPPVLSDTLVATSGRVYIEMNTDASGSYPGFELIWWSKPLSTLKPDVSFSSPDSVCTNNAITFVNDSVDNSLTYFWDADNDLTTDESNGNPNLTYAFFFPGEYTITLVGRNACGEADTFTKNITVFNPQAPSASFTADNTRPTTTDVVFFTADIEECVDDYKWTFKHSGTGTVTFTNGTNSFSANPQVIFNNTGCYDAKLYVKNVSGEDSLTLNCYINVKAPYCVPSVTTNIQDVGISKVTIDTRLNSESSQGLVDYENFVNTRRATINLGETFEVTVERTTNRNEVTRTIWIDWNQDGDFTDNGEKVAENVNAKTLSWNASVKVPATALAGATVMRIAINLGTNSNSICGPNRYGEYEDYRLYVTPDVTLPVITLIGDETIFLEQGFEFSDPGATAEDNLDGDISAKIVVTEPKAGYNIAPGTYYFLYNVSDAAGNKAITVIRTIIVTEDVTPPQLIVSTPDTIYVAVGAQSFPTPTVISAFDRVDGDLIDDVVTSGNVNTAVVDTFTLTYYVIDFSGNDTSVTRTVIVLDTIAPVLTLIGNDTLMHDVGDAFNDPGVSISDNYYDAAMLQSLLVVQSNVNPNIAGTYTITYSLTDPSGNIAPSVSRIVIVRDIVAPEIVLNGDSTLMLDVHSFFVDPGVTVSDNYDVMPKITYSGSFYQEFPNGKATKLGTYIIIYTVTDSSGNSASVAREIIVVDRVAPVITLIGEPGANVCRWATYTDAGYTVTDNYYPSDSITVTTEGSFTQIETAVEGTYYLRYKAEDSSGNVGYSEWRQVVVRNPYEFPCATATAIKNVNDLEKAVTVYPNPNAGKFTVEANLPANEQVRLTITNMVGQQVAVISNGGLQSNKFTVDLSNHASGIYLLNITTSNHTVTKRIVVNK